jgi:type I restriction enzyme S subunit
MSSDQADWVRVKLSDASHVSWGDTSTTKASYVSEGFRAFSASGQDGYLDHFDHEGPGIVLSAIGAKCGKTWFTDGRWSCIKNTIYLKAKPAVADPRFLYYVTSNPDFWPKRGSAQPFISQGDARRTEILLPSLKVQRRIAAILCAYDDLIEVNRRRIGLLEEMARALFDEWFVRFRFPGHEGVTITKRSEGPLPEGWRLGCMSDIADQIGRSVSPAITPDESFAHFSIPAFDDGCAPAVENGSEIMSNKLHFSSPAILISKLNPRIPRLWLVLEDYGRRQIASTEFVPIAGKKPFSAGLVYAYVKSAGFCNRLRGMASGTSTSHQRVKPGDILASPIAIPPHQIAELASAQLDDLYALAVTLRKNNRLLAISRDLLLPRIVSGQLTLPAAEVTLERASVVPGLVDAI